MAEFILSFVDTIMRETVEIITQHLAGWPHSKNWARFNFFARRTCVFSRHPHCAAKLASEVTTRTLFEAYCHIYSLNWLYFFFLQILWVMEGNVVGWSKILHWMHPDTKEMLLNVKFSYTFVNVCNQWNSYHFYTKLSAYMQVFPSSAAL